MNKISLTTGISQQQKQQLRLTPALKQSIEMIQMTSLELDQWLDQKIQENPFLLEADDFIPPENSSDDTPSEEINLELVETEVDFSMSDDSAAHLNAEKEEWPNSNNSADIEWGDIQAQIVAPISFHQELEQQLLGMPLSPEVLAAAKFIIGNLDEDGLLPDGIEALIDQLMNQETSIERSSVKSLFEEALAVVQSLEPAGVGACHLTEFLCLQVKRLNAPTDIKQIAALLLNQYPLKDLVRPNIQAIGQSCGTDAQRIKEALNLIKSLDPKIVVRTNEIDENRYVSIDLKSYKKDGFWFVVLNRHNIKHILFNSNYQGLVQETQEAKQASVVQWQQEAKQILYQLQQRQSTLLKIGLEIAKKQQLFFEKGIRALTPMVLKDIATAIDMNESTISRLVNGKYLQTLHGVFELKQLFSTGFVSEKTGEENASQTDQEEVSSNTIKSFIQDLIRGENSNKPYSDQRISEWLKETHRLDVARRTVAKYRDLMGIPAASERKLSPEM